MCQTSVRCEDWRPVLPQSPSLGSALELLPVRNMRKWEVRGIRMPHRFSDTFTTHRFSDTFTAHAFSHAHAHTNAVPSRANRYILW